MTNIDRAENVIYEAITGDGFSAPELRTRRAARALADAGLLAPEPQIIRTRDELAALDPDTVLGVWHPDLDWGCIFMTAREWAFEQSVMPLSVIATGEQARAARQALEDTDATD